MSEKNLAPTAKRIEDARKKGQVGVSRDVTRLAMLVAGGELAFATESYWRGAILSLMAQGIHLSGVPFSHALGEMLMSAGTLLMLVFGTFFLLCPVIAFASHWGQFGILISTEVLTPKFDKLNPVNGLKQMFSMRKLGEVLLTLAKFILISLMCYIIVRDQLPDIVRLCEGAPKDVYVGFVTLLHMVFHVAIGLCVCIALIDLGLQKHSHTKSLKMNFEEMKREFKESEGDPMVKGQRRQLAMEWAMGDQAAAQTEGANAVVVNPTHFAVAMFYDGQSVPVVRVKGKDQVARAMIARARKLGIPVIRHVWLARTLYATGKNGRVVPKASYDAVAQVYAVVEELRQLNQMDRVVELNSDGAPPEDLM